MLEFGYTRFTEKFFVKDGKILNKNSRGLEVFEAQKINNLHDNFNDEHIYDEDFYFNDDKIHGNDDKDNIGDDENDDLGYLDQMIHDNFRPCSSTSNELDLNKTFYSSEEELEESKSYFEGNILSYIRDPLTDISVNLDQISFNQSQDLSSAEDQQIFFSDESNFTFNQQVIQNPPNTHFEVEDFSADFMFYIENFFLEQQIMTEKQTIYNNGFSDLTV